LEGISLQPFKIRENSKMKRTLKGGFHESVTKELEMLQKENVFLREQLDFYRHMYDVASD